MCCKQHLSVSKQLPPARVGPRWTCNLRVEFSWQVETTRQQPQRCCFNMHSVHQHALGAPSQIDSTHPFCSDIYDQLTSASSMKLLYHYTNLICLSPFCHVNWQRISCYFSNIDPLFVNPPQEKFCVSKLFNCAHLVFPLLHPSLYFFQCTLVQRQSSTIFKICYSFCINFMWNIN